MSEEAKQSRVERILNWLVWFLRFDIVAGIIWMLAIGNWEAFFINIFALLLTFAPNLAAKRYGIKLPMDYIFIIVTFIYLSMFLGETFDAYEKFFWWDAALHLASGIVISFAGFLVLYIMDKRGRIKASAFAIALFTFSFGMALGGVWEIFEFGMDSIFGTNMQKNGLSDTMWDLIVDAIGSLLVAWFAYDILKNNNRKGYVYSALERFVTTNDINK